MRRTAGPAAGERGGWGPSRWWRVRRAGGHPQRAPEPGQKDSDLAHHLRGLQPPQRRLRRHAAALQRGLPQRHPAADRQGAEPLEKITTMMAGERIDLCGTRPDLLASFVEGPIPCAISGSTSERDTATVKESDHAEGLSAPWSGKAPCTPSPWGSTPMWWRSTTTSWSSAGSPRPARTGRWSRWWTSPAG